MAILIGAIGFLMLLFGFIMAESYDTGMQSIIGILLIIVGMYLQLRKNRLEGK